MSSISARALKAGMKAVKPKMGDFTLDQHRQMQDKAIQLCMPSGITEYLPVTVASMRAAWEGPHVGAPEDCAVLYCHGGAYMYGSLPYARVIASKIALAAGMNVLAIEYPLAPENPFPAALDAAVEAYRYLLNLGFDPMKLTLAGESAGGNLVLVLLLRLKELGMPLPAAVVAISPWGDLGGRGDSYRRLAEEDPVLDPDTILDAAKFYIDGHSWDDPLASPVFGDFTGCPPVLIQCTDSELLYSDCQELNRRMLEQGVDVTLHCWHDMWHVFQCYPIPEAKTAVDEIGRFFRKQLDLPKRKGRFISAPFRNFED